MSRPHFLLRNIGAQLRDQPAGNACLGHILLVGAAGDYGELLAAILPECRIAIEPSTQQARRQFLSTPIDLVILHHTPLLPCLELLPDFKAQRPSIAVIVTTLCGSEDLAVQALRHGAIDYFSNPIALEELALSVRAILEIRRRFQDSGQPLPIGGLQRALRYLETHFHEPLRLDAAAREAGMSLSCFERCLKSQTGLTFVTYLNSLRIAKARELLRRSGLSMLQIALTCGFGNQSHFNRVFRKMTGLTPGACRKKALAPAAIE